MLNTKYEPISRANILNSTTLRGPELARLYEGIAKHGLRTEAQLFEAFGSREGGGLNTIMIKEVLDYLRLLEIIGRYRGSSGAAEFDLLVSPVEREFPFKLLLLGRLNGYNEGKNAFVTVQRYVAYEGETITSIAELRVKLEQVADSEHSVNDEKLGLWGNLAAYLGLIHRIVPDPKTRSTSFLIIPTVELVLDTLRAYQATHRDNSIPARPWMAFVEKQFFKGTTNRGDVHPGLAETILSLPQCGLSRFDLAADDPASLAVGGRKISRIILN